MIPSWLPALQVSQSSSELLGAEARSETAAAAGAGGAAAGAQASAGAAASAPDLIGNSPASTEPGLQQQSAAGAEGQAVVRGVAASPAAGLGSGGSSMPAAAQAPADQRSAPQVQDAASTQPQGQPAMQQPAAGGGGEAGAAAAKAWDPFHEGWGSDLGAAVQEAAQLHADLQNVQQLADSWGQAASWYEQWQAEEAAKALADRHPSFLVFRSNAEAEGWADEAAEREDEHEDEYEEDGDEGDEWAGADAPAVERELHDAEDLLFHGGEDQRSVSAGISRLEGLWQHMEALLAPTAVRRHVFEVR